mgnify:CR=1 FL=1
MCILYYVSSTIPPQGVFDYIAKMKRLRGLSNLKFDVAASLELDFKKKYELHVSIIQSPLF